MFNVYRFIFSTVNTAALTSALQSLLALATAEAQSAEKVTEEEEMKIFPIHQSMMWQTKM